MRAFLKRYERWLWMALLAGIVAFRWPLLKGFYYRTAHVEAPAGHIAWRTDFDAALAEARRTNKPLLVDFSASWCPPCLAMKHDVWPDPTVERQVTGSYVPMLIDVDHDGGVSDRYQVDTIPAILILNADGHVIRRAGYLPALGVLRFLAGH